MTDGNQSASFKIIVIIIKKKKRKGEEGVGDGVSAKNKGNDAIYCLAATVAVTGAAGAASRAEANDADEEKKGRKESSDIDTDSI